MGDKILGFIGAAISIGFFGFIGVNILWSVLQFGTDLVTSCETTKIPFVATSQYSGNYTEGTQYTDTKGVAGEQKVCTRFGETVDTEVTKQPVNELTLIGTKPIERYVPPAQTFYESTPAYGSVCNDGTWSPSTGRGTCSWHNGVSYTL